MPYTYTLTATIPASPQDIYEAWLDSRAHSAMTGAKATQSDEVGAAVSAWDDYITGNNVELVPGERIVQTWRTTEFTDEHGDSIITVTLEPVPGGTNLTLEHANVPDEHTSYEESGWQEYYFDPMRLYFRGAANGAAKAQKKVAKKAAKKSVAKKKKAPVKKKAAAKKKAAPKKKSKKKRAVASKRAPARRRPRR